MTEIKTKDKTEWDPTNCKYRDQCWCQACNCKNNDDYRTVAKEAKEAV